MARAWSCRWQINIWDAARYVYLVDFYKYQVRVFYMYGPWSPLEYYTLVG